MIETAPFPVATGHPAPAQPASGAPGAALLTDRYQLAMLIGYVRVSKSDGSQTLAPQRDALIAAGVATMLLL